MHGKVWMFSNLIDDEDIEFMQHEFISYKQAMDYYELGYKPRVIIHSFILSSILHPILDETFNSWIKTAVSNI